jgi:hypothetical protein
VYREGYEVLLPGGTMLTPELIEANLVSMGGNPAYNFSVWHWDRGPLKITLTGSILVGRPRR